MGCDECPRPRLSHYKDMDATDIQGKRQRFLFLTSIALVVAGGLVAQLGATSATTLAGGYSSGSFDTGVYLTVSTLFAGFMAVRALPLARRLGIQRTWAWVNVVHMVMYVVLGVLILRSESDTIVLFLAAPLIGTITGLLAVVSPLMTQSFLGGGIAQANSRRAAVAGVVGAVSLVIGGTLIHLLGPGIGLLLGGLLGAPLTVFAFRAKPSKAIPPVQSPRHPLRTAIRTAAQNPKLRNVAVLSSAAGLLYVPFIMLIVPILHDLRHDPLPSGAGLVLAGMSLGKLLTPRIVRRLEASNRTDFEGVLLAAAGITVLLYCFVFTLPIPRGSGEIAIWAVIGIGIGALRASVISLMEGAAANAGGKGYEAEGMAVMTIFGTFAAPVGALVWGWSIQQISSAYTIMIAATLFGVVLLVLHQFDRRAVELEGKT